MTDTDFWDDFEPEKDSLIDNVSINLDNVEVEVPASSFLANDVIENIITDRKKLSDRLQNDSEFEKRYIQAEKEYSEKARGLDPKPEFVDDAVYAEAQKIVERIHKKTPVTQPEPEPEKDLSKILSGVVGKVIYINNVQKLVIKIKQ